MVGKTNSNLPPGFRFHPTDEELIIYYLRNQATSKPCPVSIIPEVDIYKFDPWDLPEKTEFGENEWYFFTPRDRKYPNGVRPNRAAVSGYWKATGTDKAIYSGSKYVGVKKALVFYKGRPPKGTKTDWIMHEYRLNESRSRPNKQLGSMRLDDWVLCRIYKKKNAARALEEKAVEDLSNQTAPSDNATVGLQSMTFPRTFSLAHLWELESLGPISQILGDNFCNATSYDNQNTVTNTGNGSMPRITPVAGMQNRSMDSVKFQVNPTGVFTPSNFLNPMFEFQ